MGPLVGVRVLDLSRILAGPWATQALADYGAEVIKIERPGEGDDTRKWGPPYLHDAGGRPTGESAYYLSCNRGKRSVAIDFSRPEGAELVRALAEQSDVLVENFKPGALARYGLDYGTLAGRHPGLIYLSITGYGQSGPNAHLPGYDAMVQASAGLMSITGQPDGEPGAGPVKVGVAVADLMCGMYGLSAVLAALYARARHGRGQHIDLALWDSQVAWLANQAGNYLVGGQIPSRLGSAHPNIVPYQAFATADGHLLLAIGNDRQFASFCQAAGRAEWASDARFASNSARVAHRRALIELLAPLLAQRSTAAWIELCAAAQVPCGPIQNLEQVFADRQCRARGLRVDLPHAAGVEVPGVANPVRFSVDAIEYRQAPPTLGQHTELVLGTWLGATPEQMSQWRRDGVIQ